MNEPFRVRASIRLLSAAEGGRFNAIRGSYRPNHNFFEPGHRGFSIGFIELPEGGAIQPGQVFETEIAFVREPWMRRHICPGREWRLQEAQKLVAIGTVLEVLP